ncbi:hypothetical protein [Marivita sp.]|jgi:hypothetical protein|uniref:hypothetical protein n=1 Tax=Marivita sp. TaxID=2003365 RepID=UPI003F6C4991
MSHSETHLILVVHGIGEQSCGETVDQVVAGAVARHPSRPASDLADAPISVQSSHLTLTEEDFTQTGDDPVQPVFDCHTHTLGPAGEGQQRAVFAEVHWSDLSPAPKGAVATILDLLKLILGLGYVALDNVENTKSSLFDRGLVHLFNWVFYGGIAVINAMLLIGTVLVLGNDYLPGVSYLSVLVVNVGLGVGLWAYLKHQGTKSPRFLLTVFRRGVLVWSWLTTLLLALSVFAPETVLTKFQSIFAALPGTVTAQSKGCAAFVALTDTNGDPLPLAQKFGIDSLSCFIEVNIFAMGLLWVFAALVVVVSLVGFKDTPKRIIYPSICGAMLMFWSVFTTGFWLVLQQLLGQLSGTNNTCAALVASLGDASSLARMTGGGQTAFGLLCLHMEQAVGTLAISVAFMLLTLAAAVLAYAVGARVIVNVWVRAILVVFPVALVLILILGGDITGNSLDANPFAPFRTLSITIALGVALLIYNFNETVAAALGVARDVIVYLVRAECKWTATPEQREGNYPRRALIEARFDRVFWFMLNALEPDRITVISHSQGTVVAARSLQRLMPELRAFDPTLPSRMHLITMGSPISHIYEEYFPENYPLTVAQISSDMTWHNLYRTKDYVGQTIGTTGIPPGNDLCVGHGGHSHYFTDQRVWTLLWERVGFRLFSTPPGMKRVSVPEYPTEAAQDPNSR